MKSNIPSNLNNLKKAPPAKTIPMRKLLQLYIFNDTSMNLMLIHDIISYKINYIIIFNVDLI